MERLNIKPFFVELAVSNLSVCEVCYQNIIKQDVRIASMSYSKDKGSVPMSMFHIGCLFPEIRNDGPQLTGRRAQPNYQRIYPTNLDQIDGLELLRLQNEKEYEKVKNKVETVSRNVESESPPKLFKQFSEDVPNYKYSKRVLKLTMKDGHVMDQFASWSGVQLMQSAHILKENGKSYSETLCKVDLDKEENNYYKIQILESDKLQYRYWLFRSFGRIGEIHTAKHFCDQMLTKEDAILAFDRIVLDTQNLNFTPMQIDYGQVTMINSEPYIKLEPQLDKFVRKIFAVPPDSYDFDFELDVGKTPLGLMSQGQLVKAYGILAGLTEMIDQKEENSEPDPAFYKVVMELTNQYLTLVPRRFPQNDPPLLNTSDRIQAEVEHVENLMEMDLKLTFTPKQQPTTHSLYKSLNCDIVVIKKDSEIYQILNKYLNNTLAWHHEHGEFGVTLDNIYSVSRGGENELFSKSKHVGNRKLLWHGSPTANIRGILSNGLGLSSSYDRYNPAAVSSPSTNGSRTTIFFADMASKSISYCKPTPENNTGALLLSEVALGNLAAEQWSYSPTGSSSVGSTYNFVRGQIQPDPKEFHVLPNQVVVPYGKPPPINPTATAGYRTYNEYIVYDKAQVNLQFLLEITFNYRNNVQNPRPFRLGA